MKKFRIKEYNLTSPKLCGGKESCFVFLTDLHGLEFGEENHDLHEAIKKIHPDAVLIAGDMIVKGERDSLYRAQKFLLSLAPKYPVYYALGNHEYKLFLSEERKKEYLQYEKKLRQQGVHFLRNEKAYFDIAGQKFCIHGLELPIEYYHKPNSPKLSAKEMTAWIGKPDSECYNILLAHNPKYGKAYLNWGADLTLSGHYHGGVVRFSENHGLSCPQYLFLPPYCCGHFEKNEKHMLVSAGMGEHTLPIRIHNPRELLVIRISA